MFEWLHRLVDRMPVEASPWAPKVDWLNNFITYTAIFCTLLLSGLMLFFMIRYRRRPDNAKSSYITHNTFLEIIWTAVPTLVVLFVFYYGLVYFREMRTPPNNALEINVEAYKWGWNFEYNTGKRSSNELVVPAGKPIKLIMRSRDVNHSFFIPSMRVKEDVLANTYHYLWFTPIKTGEFPIFCAEYCGINHSYMRATLRVVPEEEFNAFTVVSAAPTDQLAPAELGKKLYAERGCLACHSLDGSVVIGPSFKELTKHEVELSDGTKLTPEENYLRESILNPNAKIVKGFQPNLMPQFQGMLSDEEVNALIAFLKTQ